MVKEVLLHRPGLAARAVGSDRGSIAGPLQRKRREGWPCACESASRLGSSQKRAANDDLTAGWIQSCFYRQMENPLIVAFLGIICSP